MAKKNTITFSIITVVIIIGYVSLTGSNQWGTNNAATNQTKQPLENSQINDNIQTYNMNVTALIPPSESFERMVNELTLENQVNISIDYADENELSYQNYIDFLLTKESGDIHLIPNEWVIPLAVQGYLMPFDRVVTTEYIEEQTNVLIDSMKWNSSIWAAPYELNPYIVIPHQSISDYLIEDDVQSIENTVSQEESDENVNNENEDISSFTNRFEVVQNIISSMSSDDVLINLDEDGFKELYHFLFYIDSQGITDGTTLSEYQLSLLKILANEPSLYSEFTLDELVSGNQQQPLFIILKWSELSQYRDELEQFYSIEQLVVPIQWTNGYSFVIKQQSKQHQIAGQWIEALHRKMSESHNVDEGMPIHKRNLSQLQADWQKNVSTQFAQKLDAYHTMVVSTKWPIQFEQLQKSWLSTNNNVDRINMWISESNILINE